MGRIRTVKPDVFTHECLFDLEHETHLPVRLAYIGLWTVCDREGRFQWRPRLLQTDIMPYDDVEFARVLDALERGGFVIRYQVGSEIYGCIPSWQKHQVINQREKQSEIPGPTPENVVSSSLPLFETHMHAHARTCNARAEIGNAHGEGEGEGEGEREESLTGGQPTNKPTKPDSVVVEMLLKTGQREPITDAQVRNWQKLYPSVDVMQEVRNMAGWCEGNAEKRKTAAGILRFVHTWLKKEQAKPAPIPAPIVVKSGGSTRDASDLIEQRRQQREANRNA